MPAPKNLLLVLLLSGAVLLVGVGVGRLLSGWGWFRSGSQVVFLAPDQSGDYQLFRLAAGQDRPAEQLTTVPGGVIDFAVSPTGRHIALTMPTVVHGADLALFEVEPPRLTPLVGCGEAVCAHPSWSPDGMRIIYERGPAPAEGDQPPRLWWVDIRSEEAVPLFDDPALGGQGAVFSPDGGWIAFHSPTLESIRLYDTLTGETIDLHSRSGERPVWGPEGVLFFTNFRLRDEALLTHLYRYDLAEGDFRDLSGAEAFVNDGSAVWSAAAGWIAFTRRPARAPLGGQLWLMRPDGSEAHSLSGENGVHNGAPAWSADGRRLLFQRFHYDRPEANPEIWLYDLATGDERLLAAHGSQPAWLP